MADFPIVPDPGSHRLSVVRTYGTAPGVELALARAGFGVAAGEGPADLHCAVVLGESGYCQRENKSTPLPRERLIAALDRARSGGRERFVLVTDASPWALPGSRPDCSAALAAELGWWRWLVEQAAARQICANTVRLGYAPFVGHQLDERTVAALQRCQLVPRPADVDDLASALRMLAGPAGDYVVGETLALDGGLDAGYIPPVSTAPSRAAADGPLPPPGAGPVMVTGASSGIGAAVARQLAAEGVPTVLIARRAEPLRHLAEQAESAGTPAHVLPADLSVPEAVPDVVAQAHELTGGIHRLCYAAGTLLMDHPRTPSRSEEARDLMMRTNVASFAAMCDQLVAYWIEHEIAGAVASVSSVTAHSAPLSHCHSYGSTKAALAQYTRMLATTVARYGIRANVVRPGIIGTPMAEAAGDDYHRAWLARVPMRRIGAPEEVAALLVELLSPRSAYLSGSQLLVDGGLHLGMLPVATGVDGVGSAPMTGTGSSRPSSDRPRMAGEGAHP